MYSRESVRNLIELAEKGILKLGKSAGVQAVGTFSFDEWNKAFQAATENSDWGKPVLFVP